MTCTRTRIRFGSASANESVRCDTNILASGNRPTELSIVLSTVKLMTMMVIHPVNILRGLSSKQFLDASTYLYKRVCPFVRPSVRPSIRRSVTRFCPRRNLNSVEDYSSSSVSVVSCVVCRVSPILNMGFFPNALS